MSKRIYSLQWSAVENAQTYRVFRSLTEVGNKQELVLTSNRSLELNQYIPGSSDYYYFIKAQATGYQDSDYSTPLRWKTFSISRSVDTGVIETTDDSFVGEGFGYNTGFVAPDGKIFNRAVCLLTIGGIQHPEYISFLTGDKAFNIDIPAEAVTGDIVYSAVVQDEITQLTTPTIAMNADGKTLEITDVANATSYDVYVDGNMKTNVASVPNTTTLDLSTLSDIADGAHTVKVKAKADGYRDSEFSNEVSYTKAPAGYAITFGTITSEHTFKYNGSNYNIKFDDGSYLRLGSSSDVSVEYYDANDNRIGNIAVGGDNMAIKFGVDGVNSSTVEYYGRLTQYPEDTDFGYFTVGDSEHLSPTISSSNPHTTKTVSGELNIYGKYPD